MAALGSQHCVRHGNHGDVLLRSVAAGFIVLLVIRDVVVIAIRGMRRARQNLTPSK
jgi:hypothetical protein